MDHFRVGLFAYKRNFQVADLRRQFITHVHPNTKETKMYGRWPTSPRKAQRVVPRGVQLLSSLADDKYYLHHTLPPLAQVCPLVLYRGDPYKFAPNPCKSVNAVVSGIKLVFLEPQTNGKYQVITCASSKKISKARPVFLQV